MPNPAAYLASLYTSTRLMGDKAVSSDATMVISGAEEIMLLTKSFPWPFVSSQGEIEVSTPLGAQLYQPQQLKVAHQGPVTFYETKAGHLAEFIDLLGQSGQVTFDATMYEGTPDAFYRALAIRDAFFTLDNPDRDWENRSQAVMVSGTLFYHYFGEVEAGNLT